MFICHFKIDFTKVLISSIPIFIVLVGWVVNEYLSREKEAREKRIFRYETLIISLNGLYDSAFIMPIKYDDNSKKINSIGDYSQVNIAWIWCSDNIIKEANSFYNNVYNNDEINAKASLFRLMLLIRKEVDKKTKLTQDNIFKIPSQRL